MPFYVCWVDKCASFVFPFITFCRAKTNYKAESSHVNTKIHITKYTHETRGAAPALRRPSSHLQRTRHPAPRMLPIRPGAPCFRVSQTSSAPHAPGSFWGTDAFASTRRTGAHVRPVHLRKTLTLSASLSTRKRDRVRSLRFSSEDSNGETIRRWKQPLPNMPPLAVLPASAPLALGKRPLPSPPSLAALFPRGTVKAFPPREFSLR